MLLEAQGMEGGHHRVLPAFCSARLRGERCPSVKKDVASLQVEGGGLHGGD